MPANRVNLDALIPRLDFDAGPEPTTKPGDFDKIFAHDLTKGRPLYGVLRKPDFQRETAIWTPDKVRDLVVAFVDEDLVPALILWRSPTNHIFVIDGAHRLSSLAAWVNNDYGTGNLSYPFFEGQFSSHEKAAKAAKDLVEDAIGPYRDISEAFSVPNPTAKNKQIAAKLVNCSLRVQWLTGDSTKAERSFFKINEQGVPLTNTELTLLYSRKCPNSIAARAINQRGAGHPFWKEFQEKKKEIEKLAQELHDSLFQPPLMANTVKTPELPIAGRVNAATTLSLLLDTVNLTNGIEGTVPHSKVDAEKSVPPDKDGTQTVDFLKRTKRTVLRISNRVSTDDVSALNLHPLVYFYSENGNHLPSLFLAVVELMNEYEKNNSFKAFTLIREKFENFLVDNKDLIQQVSRSTRGQIKAVHKIKEFLAFVVKSLQEYQGRKPDAHVKSALAKSQVFSFLRPTAPAEHAKTSKDFSAAQKSRKFIEHALENAARCTICYARIPDYGISFDHKHDKKLGGGGELANIQFSHPYCNSAKDTIVAVKAKLGPATAASKL